MRKFTPYELDFASQALSYYAEQLRRHGTTREAQDDADYQLALAAAFYTASEQVRKAAIKREERKLKAKQANQ